MKLALDDELPFTCIFLSGDDTNVWSSNHTMKHVFCLTEVTPEFDIKTVLGFIMYIGNLNTGVWNPYESYLKNHVWLKNTYGICG